MLLISLAGASTLHAQKTTAWTGAISSDWSDGGNWDNGAPAAGDTVILRDSTFATVTNNPTNYNLGDQNFANITIEIQDGSTGFTVSDAGTSTVTLTATSPGDTTITIVPPNTTSNQSVAYVFDFGLEVANQQTWNISRSLSSQRITPSVTVNGVLSGAGDLSFSPSSAPINFGSGALALANTANTFTGVLRNNSINNQLNFASIGDGGELISGNNNARFSYTGPAATIMRDFRATNNNGAIQNDGTGILTLNGNLIRATSNELRLNADDNDIIVTGGLSDSGSRSGTSSFNATGGNRVEIQGAITTINPIYVDGGNTVLALTGMASADTVEEIRISGNSTLDVSGKSSDFVLQSNQVLGGAGRVEGTVVTTDTTSTITPSFSNVSNGRDGRLMEGPNSNNTTQFPDWGRTFTMENLDASNGVVLMMDLGTSQSQLDIEVELIGSDNPGEFLFEFFNTDNIMENDEFLLIEQLAGATFTGVDVTDFAAVAGVPVGLEAQFFINASGVNVRFVPEPGATVLLGMAMGMLIFRRHRRFP